MDSVLLGTQARVASSRSNGCPCSWVMFTEQMAGGVNRLVANRLTLQTGRAWRRCHSCKSVHRPVGALATCIDCESADITNFDPETDEVYRARRGLLSRANRLRTPIKRSAAHHHIAAEHTAQLGAAQPMKRSRTPNVMKCVFRT